MASGRRARMADWNDVRRLALAMPGAEERISRGLRQWRVDAKLFVWERPLNKTDLAALGATAPVGAILGARVEHVGVRTALLASDPEVFFTIPHFDNYPAILLRLGATTMPLLRDVVIDAWLARAPRRLVAEYRSDG